MCVCACVLELAEQCFPFLIRVAQTPAAGSMGGGGRGVYEEVLEQAEEGSGGGERRVPRICVYLFEGARGGNERRNIIRRRPLML